MLMPVPGVRVGHSTDAVGATGCTVVELPAGSIASYEVRGGAPACRELLPLEPDKSVTTVDAVLLTGGSVFGLAAADGVVRYLAERGRGVGTPAGPVPIVPTLGLFDLASGSSDARPDADAGYAAMAAAASEFAVGRVGAGTGASASNWRREGRRGGGLGYGERRLGDVIVAAIVAVNAFGDIVDAVGADALDAVAALSAAFDFDRTNTTIGVVVTNARLDKVACRIVAQGAHDGLARSVTPPHTRFDGDGFVAAATGEVATHPDVVRMLAVAAVAEAIRSTAS
ncbi:P1 family peptidase [Propioniciclava tarda]|uniref:Peptidase S58 family protein n=1 Tax=Propioniciclava tarda TaxID=433330 RepID=A0A4Q9KJF8_PROTD|nr:P1 family peptidase [Propioniciclava tarda]TBT94285.1 peptidase S58 family protein [Propioniciclava tarda]SMO73874.1 L-aminopeptidase/D-esterase [Propioniciclava tarda]HOA87813.1 P1 family peptidase [Propioniciclava tarda]HQA29871.1 P1 family peptidase [Propioniciclava tarda]HQD59713.1 P1 family peptidase [Propioniciclava tarda]